MDTLNVNEYTKCSYFKYHPKLFFCLFQMFNYVAETQQNTNTWLRSGKCGLG